jgi:hypothetical protein
VISKKGGKIMKFEHRVRQWALATCLIIAMAKSVVNFIVLGETLQRISHFVLAALSILLALYLFLTTPENKKMFKEIKDLFKEGK